jgi:aspartate ammonia-lyase
VFELVMERGLLTREQLDKALDPEAMTAPRPAVAAPAAPPVGKTARPAKR